MNDERKTLRVPRQRRPVRIALVTDFGVGPYIGQMRLLAAASSPTLPVIDLISDLPAARPDLAAYLLPGLVRGMPECTLYLCVVDPGVGSDRGVLAVRIGTAWFLAPDNGILVPLVRQAGGSARVWRVLWRPAVLSASLHGRDLFLPLAQRVCGGTLPGAVRIGLESIHGFDLPAMRPSICYVDGFGNAMTGLKASEVAPESELLFGASTRVARARTFSDVTPGVAFWYENAFGLLEIAVNQGRADSQLRLRPGDPITFAP